MTRVSLLALVGLFASSAQAKELTFFFDVHSSGPEIYPCDAGIVQGKKDRFCHYKGTKDACTPEKFGQTPSAAGITSLTSVTTGETVDPKDPAHACICTGTDGGAYLMNFIRYKAATWEGGALPTSGEPNWNHLGWSEAKNGVIQGNQEGATVARMMRPETTRKPANDTRQEFATQLEQVTFNFGSELYGAHFFVDLCYRGPQIPYYVGSDSANNATATFWTRANLTTTNPFTVGPTGSRSTLDYAKISGLGMRYEMVCDHQGKGNYKFDHNGASYDSGSFDTMDNDIVDEGNIDLPPDYVDPPKAGNNWVGNLKGDGFYVPPTFVGNAELVANSFDWLFGHPTEQSKKKYINIKTPEVPRFCKLRYYFAEKPFNDRERAWQRADARFIAKWVVEEGEETAE